MGYLDDVKAQPEVLEQVAGRLSGSEAIRHAAARIATSTGVWLTGMGSSYAAALFGGYALCNPERWAQAIDAGEALHYVPASSLKALPMVAISQSGQSFETLKLAEKVHQKVPLVSITNRADSPLARLADVPVALDVPPDEAVSIKTYTATLVAIGLIASELGHVPAVSPRTIGEALREAIGEGEERARSLGGGFADRSVSVIARGCNVANAYFGALLFKEVAGQAAEPVTGGQFRHGPIELAGPGHAAVILAPEDGTAQLQHRLAMDLAAAGSYVVFVAPRGRPAPPGTVPWETPLMPEPWSVLIHACVLQWLAWGCAMQRGREPGRLLRTPKVVDYE